MQAGYGVGTVDTSSSSVLAVYEEASDLNSGSGAVAHFYAADPLGNHHFYVNYQNETGYGGRGLYQAYANSTYLGGSWQILPAQTQFYAQIEADNFSGSNETCPNIHDGQLGMNGVDPPNWDSTTELYILQPPTGWQPWNLPSLQRHT
ncbi:MAG TPA: hypothetical protein VFJ21_07295 [Mycobacteriales bacterium]|nr:hypothetical protein [Mycobacteriales bacterium]